MSSELSSEPIFSHSEPVLAVKDVSATIAWWGDMLGFPTHWSWGDPPRIGAVSWHGAHVQFAYDPVLADASVGNHVWIRLRRIEALYALHQARGVEIVDGLRMHEYGLAQYSIRDCNGYYIHFAGAPPREFSRDADGIGASDVKGFDGEIAFGSRIVERVVKPAEFQALELSLGGNPSRDMVRLERRLGAAIYGVVAEDEVRGEVIGCALLVGDHSSYYYVKDVLVRQDLHGRRVGTAMMRAMSEWLDKHGVKGALVALICREELEGFYRQFGFIPVFGMMKEL